jgi:hypothetical protein
MSVTRIGEIRPIRLNSVFFRSAEIGRKPSRRSNSHCDGLGRFFPFGPTETVRAISERTVFW